MPAVPGSLGVEVTTRCNRGCVYCYNVWKDGDGYPSDELPGADLVALVVRVLGQSGIRSVQVTGGEPLLRPDLLQILDGLRAPGRSLGLVTDGGLITDELARELGRLGVAPVQPTLLAARREVHERLKGAEGSFDDTVAAIVRLRKAGVPVCVSFVCTRQNHAHFQEVVELCFALGVRSVAFSRFCATGLGRRALPQLMPTAAMIQGCLDVAQEANARLGMRVRVAISLPLCVADPLRYPDLRFGRCALSSEQPGFTVDPMGRLRGCSVSSEVLGDLRTESWAAVVSRARRGFLGRAATVPTACRACQLSARCGGGCRESALGRWGTLDAPDPLVAASP